MNTNLNRQNLSFAYFGLTAVYLIVNALIGIPLASVFKILPCSLMLASLCTDSSNVDRKTWWLVVFALSFSIVGDIASEFKAPGALAPFLIQVIFFSMANLCYAVSMSRFVKFTVKFTTGQIVFRVVSLFVIGFLFVITMSQFLRFIENPALSAAIVLYVLLITVSACLSCMQIREAKWTFVLGTFLFIASNLFLAYDAFVKPIPQPYRDFEVLATYLVAQYFLNISLVTKRS